ncbi:MAG: PP2C family protein-serine/threonine phosphatase [Candidatus Babeliaceae bacterium]|jgi:protein phosphatase 1L
MKYLAFLITLFTLQFPCLVLATASDIGFAEAQGRRPTMEDAHCVAIQTHIAFFGLYDGHGGRNVADFAAQHLHKNMFAALQAGNHMHNALEAGFVKTHKDLDAASFNSRTQGCTAIAAVLTDGKIYVANAGDSRAIICRAGKAIALSDDHKPNRPDEQARIQKLGGKVIVKGVPRVNGRLAISRALGDKALNPYVIPNPEIREQIITTDDDFLLIACDGVWDVLDNQAAITITKTALNNNPGDFNRAADTLKNEALRRGSTDNVSVMVINLKNYRPYSS